jgi:hypothetical protein
MNVLTNDQLRALAPSVFAEHARPDVSERYSFIPTVQVVDALRGQGFMPVDAGQSKVRLADNRAFTRHMIRFRQSDALARAGDLAPELVLYNAHDRTSRYKLHGGVYRFVCANGLIVGESVAAMQISHFGAVVDNVLAATFRLVDQLPALMAQIAAWRGVVLTPEQARAYALAALAVRYGSRGPLAPEDMIAPRRLEDKSSDLWTLFNTVQEHMIRGGLNGRRSNGGRMRTRPVTSVAANLQINTGLWDLTSRAADLVPTGAVIELAPDEYTVHTDDPAARSAAARKAWATRRAAQM